MGEDKRGSGVIFQEGKCVWGGIPRQKMGLGGDIP